MTVINIFSLLYALLAIEIFGQGSLLVSKMEKDLFNSWKNKKKYEGGVVTHLGK